MGVHIPDAACGSGCLKMGKSTTSTQQSGPPASVLANYNQVYNQAQNLASQPYPTYSGSLLAGFQPQQTAGFNDVNTAVNSYQPFLNAASQDATNATGMMAPGTFGGTVGNYSNSGIGTFLGASENYGTSGVQQAEAASNSVNAKNFGNTVQNYYSPYAQSVIAPTEAQFNQQNAVQQSQLAGSAAAQGAYGGDRQAVQAAQTAGQQQLAEAPVIAGLETQGYNQAEQQAMQAAGLGETTAGMSMQNASQALQEGNLQNSAFNSATQAMQSDAWLNSQGSFAMGNLGNEAESLGLTGANAEIGAGGMQQQQAQQELNIPYQQFQQAEQNPYQMTNYLESMATGLGSLSGTQGSSTQPGPSPYSTIAGLGLTAAALGSVFEHGGRVNDDKLRAIRSLRRDIVWPHRAGGGASPMMNPMAPVGGMGAPPGSPMASNLYSQYANLPTEKLQELASRMPQNPMLQRAIQMRQMQPQADPAPQPQQMLAAPGGFANGGELRRDDGGMLPEQDYIDSGTWDQPNAGMGGGRQQQFHNLQSAMGLFNAGQRMLQRPGAQSSPVGFAYGGMIQRRPDGGPIPDDASFLAAENDPNAGQGGIAGLGPIDLTDYGAESMPVPPLPPAPPAHHSPPQSGGHGFMPGTPSPADNSADQLNQQELDRLHAPASGLGPQQPQQSSGDQGFVDSGTWDQPDSVPGMGTQPHSSVRNFMASPSGMLLAAGLGILGGRSPFASVNIGEGGLKGLELGQQAQNTVATQQLRQTEVEGNQQYKRAMAAAAQQRADTGADRANTYAQVSQASSAQKQAQAALEMARAAHQSASHATEGDVLASAVGSLANGKTVNPDTGQPWTRADALMHVKGVDSLVTRRQAQTDQGDARLAQGDERLEQGAQRIAQSQEARQLRDALVARGQDINSANADINNMARLLSSGMVLDPNKALATVQGWRGQQTQPAAAGSAQPAQMADPLGIR